MKKQTFTYLIIFALLIPVLSVTAFAAEDTDLFLDGIGGFIRNLITSIRGGFDFIGDAIMGVINAISRAISSLLDGLYYLFVPRDDYFKRAGDSLNNAIGEKFGTFVYLLKYLCDRFSGLSTNNDVRSMLTLAFPQGHVFGGTRLDLIGRIVPAITFFRGVLSGIIVLLTVGYSYNRLQSIIDT